jgi:citrate lyase subunit beta / citryl-CoA lyase
MVRLKKVFSAGRRETTTRSDCFVEIDVKPRGGLTVVVESKVSSLYGSSISALAKEVCTAIGLHHADLHIVDQGALPYVLAARIEAAGKRALSPGGGEYLTGAVARKKIRQGKDRPRRTRLYLPGNEPKFFANAGLHRPDVIILDLEDSVAPEEKDAARLLVRNALRSVDFFDAERSVRINQGRPGLEDLRTIISGKPDLILIPKCEDAETVTVVANELRGLERQHHDGREILLLPIIESALGVVNAYAIASSSARVCGLAIGLEDYTANIGVERTAEGRESLFARMSVVNAAKAAGVQALDSVYADVDDSDGLRMSTLEAKSLGFEGKGCIHPRQVAVIHSMFAPTATEIERAREIVRVAEDARKNGSGVVVLGSKMIDAPVVLRAERVLRLAEQFGEEGGVP